MTYRNLLITMMLCGLWHGASWTFVAFGAYHGLLLSLHQTFRGAWERLPLWARRIGTYGLWLLGLTIFRATGFDVTFTLLGAMFAWRPGAEIVGGNVLVVVLVFAAAIAHWGPNTFEMRHQWSPSWVAGFAVLFGVCLFVLYGARPAPSLYFQF